MATGYANVKLRPIKFAFLVPYNDKASLLEAIQLNTFLWGGIYNPIIPVYNSIPKSFPPHLKKHIKDENYLQKYLKVFAPDFTVRLGDCANQNFDKDNEENISVNDIFIGFEDWRVPHYGIGLFEILNHFASNEHKYLQRNPKMLCVPKFSGKYSLFLSSIFGQFSDEVIKIFSKRYSSYFECTYPECSIDIYSELLEKQNLFPSRLMAYQINKLGGHPSLLYMDANKFIDIVEYWNLRALGFDVIPLAKQAINSDSLCKSVLNFIEQSYKPQKHPAISYKATFYESSSINTFNFETENFLKSLEVPFRCPIRENEIDKNKVHLSYLPLIDDWAFNMFSKSKIRFPLVREARFNITNDEGQIKLVSPDFMFSTIRRVAFANDIELTTHQDEKLMAEIIPEGNNLVALTIGGFNFPEWRTKKGKLTYLSHFSDWTLNLKLPIAEDVFFRWFQNTEFDVSISDAGRIGKQMLKSLGGIIGTWLLANEQIFDLIYQKFNYIKKRKSDEAQKNIDDSKSVYYDDLLGMLKKIANQSDYFIFRNYHRLFSKLLDSKIIQLGIEVNCSFCNQPCWYSINEIKYTVKCRNCLEDFSLPIQSPKNELKWSYRTIGAFSPGTTHYGSYSALLALRFFSVTLHGKTTPIFGLKIKNKKKKQTKVPEADLALFFNENHISSEKYDLVFVECKTYNNLFSEKDFETMKLLADDFPKAFYVFATLEKQLKPKEKRIIRKFISYLKKLNPQNSITQVIILTGTELYSEKEPPECWKSKSVNIPKSSLPIGNNKLFRIAEITQIFHLS